MGNPDAPLTNFNGPTTFADRDDGQLNQFYGILQRTQADLSKNCGWYVGGDIDFMWGSDYFFTTAAGLDGRSQRKFAAVEYGSDSAVRFCDAADVCGNRLRRLANQVGSLLHDYWI